MLGSRSIAILFSAMSLGPLFAAPDFEQDVAPILEAKCLFCHNAEQAKGDLILRSRSEALLHSDALVPGAANESGIITSILGPDPEMPKKADPLPPEEIEILRRWIDAGAEWPEVRKLVYNPTRDLNWWSLNPIQPGSAPDSTLLGESDNPVDAFLAARLEENGLTPMPEASPDTLLRRLSYDLTGLPPTPEEMDAFLADPDWDAAVDRLLSSPAFGEKFAQHWLDLVRYAETHGYDKDKPRPNAWPYRDYVIRSFNEDKPFARFVEEQVAGDQLFPGNPEGVVGLGFLAAGPWDFIGHWEVGEAKLDGRIAKHLDRDEMVQAVFSTFQSTTVGCAQCHHHKFDPIRMEDYYRLHAVFAAVDRADRVFSGLSPEDEKRKHELLTHINRLKSEQGQLDQERKRLLAARVSGIDRRIAELKEKHGSGLKPQYGFHSQISKHQDIAKWVQIDLGQRRGITEIRIMPAYDDYGGIGAGFGFPVRYRVEISDDPEFEQGVRLLHDATKKDQPSPGTRVQKMEGDGRPFRYLRVTATRLAERKKDYIFALGEIELLNEGGAENFALGASVTAKDSIESGVRWGKRNLVDGIFFRELSDEGALTELRTLQEKRIQIEKEMLPPETKRRLEEIGKEILALEKKRKAIPPGKQVYAAATQFARGGRFMATAGKPRPIHLLHRGDLRSPGERMTPGAPPLWESAPEVFFDNKEWNEAEARAELAHYLTHPENPLSWRTISNRLWQWTFGQPLVGTPNDFGRGGMSPSHPELLDFLAASLRDDPNQSLKSVLRLLFTSEAYRRASTHDEKNAAIDGSNRFLWRAHRRRLTAEEIRDSILLTSGKLNREMGGPSFQDFVIEKPQHSPHYQYHLHDPEDPETHRRTVYRFVVRSQPQPMLTTLDCADPAMSVPQRDESTTALQALTQWNHPFVEAMSRHLGQSMKSEGIEPGFRFLTGRPPTEAEKSILTEHLETEGPESLARVLFNLNAFVYVD